MLTDLLIKGAIRLGICHVAAIGASKVIEASGTIDKSIPIIGQLFYDDLH